MIGGVLGKLLQFSPQILEAAQQIYTGYARRREETAETETAPGDLVQRIRALEAAGIEQSQVLAQVARQLSDVTAMLVRLERRAALASTVAAVATAVAFVAVAVAIFR